MPKSPYMKTNHYQPEKDLIMGLTQEVINLHGINVEWIHNPYTNVDPIFKEDRLPDLGASQTLCVLVKDPAGGVVGEAMFSKFGFVNQQQMTLQIAVKEWKEIFNTHRPLEGDLFYVPGFDEYGPADFYKVTYCDREDATGWFPLGKHTVFEITAEKWAYSSEDFANTGVAEIDVQLPDWSNDVTINPNFEAEPTQSNTAVQEITDAIVDWSERNPFGES